MGFTRARVVLALPRWAGSWGAQDQLGSSERPFGVELRAAVREAELRRMAETSAREYLRWKWGPPTGADYRGPNKKRFKPGSTANRKRSRNP